MIPIVEYLIRAKIKNADSQLLHDKIKFWRKHYGKNFKWHHYRYDYLNHEYFDKIPLLDSSTKSKLRNEKNFYMVVDSNHEGIPVPEIHFAKNVHKFCDFYNFPKNKIIYIDSNLETINNFRKYEKKKNLKPINCMGFFDYDEISNRKDDIDTVIEKQNIEKVFLSTNRVPRSHRLISLNVMLDNNIFDLGLISLFNIRKPQIDNPAKLGVDTSRLKPLVPLYIDTKSTHLANLRNEHFYDSVCFDIVNETQYNNSGSLFYSEKTLKPIRNYTPFIINGQQHQNKKLKDQGFELYDEIFDYSFDNESDVFKRVERMIVDNLDLIKWLNKQDNDKRVKWKFQCREKLLHNLDVLNNKKHEHEQVQKLWRQLGI